MSETRAEALTERVNNAPRERLWPNQRPKNAATLIVIDRSASQSKVLMGKRHHGHKFMAGKFVFPGGRVELDDRHMPATGTLGPRTEAALTARVVRPFAKIGYALAMAAIRETYEEAGLLLGRKVETMPKGPSEGAWKGFFERSVLPDLDQIALIGRAITPPRRPKRFDTRFFAVDRTAICDEVEGLVGPDSELVELVWVNLADARELDLPPITQVMLDELEHRVAQGFSHDLPVPFYREVRRRFVRELL